MRKKQARPARRIAAGLLPERVGSAEDSGELLSPIWHFPSVSPPVRSISSTVKPGDSAGNPFCTSDAQDTEYVFHSDIPPLKTPKCEPDDFCRAAKCTSFSRSQFAHFGSLNGHTSCIPMGCRVPNIFDVGGHRKSILSVLTAGKNSIHTNFDVSSAKVSRIDVPSVSADSESPLKRLERCVRANGKEKSSTFGFYRNSRPSASRCDMTQSRNSADSIKLRRGSDSTKTSAADALGELSQLVHRIGTAKLPVPPTPNKCVPNSITSNIFTCLKCAQRFDTLDELVLHISTTKHFTRGATKNLDAIAPWERDRAATNFEKQVASSNFLAPLFYAHKYLEIPQNLSQGNMDKNF